MSSRHRTNKRPKGVGFDYGGRFLANRGYCTCPGPGVKAETHRKERRAADRECYRAKGAN